MALKDLKLPTVIVKVGPDSEFAVRGLALDDITRIMRENGITLDAIFDTVMSGRAENMLNEDAIGDYAMTMVQSAPGVAAQLIALAADGDPDDPAEIEMARRLPVTIQIDALVKIGQLTFAMEGGPKKLLETVVMVAKGTTSLMSDLKALPNGSGKSGGK